MARRPLPALLGAAGCGIFAVLVWALAFHVDRAQWADAAALHGFTRLEPTRVAPVAERIAWLANPLPFAVLAALVVLLALHTRGPRVAAVIPVILLGANLLTQYLKPALATTRPYLELADEVDAASWPSGHATASMSLALCAVLAAPAGRRMAVGVVGALYAICVSYAIVLLTWHFPSDVLGGFAVAGAATCLGVGALRAAERRRPARPPAAGVLRHTRLVAVAAGFVVALGAAVAAAKVLLLMPDADRQVAFVAGAAGIGVLGLALVAGLAAALRS